MLFENWGRLGERIINTEKQNIRRCPCKRGENSGTLSLISRSSVWLFRDRRAYFKLEFAIISKRINFVSLCREAFFKQNSLAKLTGIPEKVLRSLPRTMRISHANTRSTASMDASPEIFTLKVKVKRFLPNFLLVTIRYLCWNHNL